MTSAFSLSKSPLCLVAMLTQMAFIMTGTTMIARQMIMTFMDFFRGFIYGLDEDMLVCFFDLAKLLPIIHLSLCHKVQLTTRIKQLPFSFILFSIR